MSPPQSPPNQPQNPPATAHDQVPDEDIPPSTEQSSDESDESDTIDPDQYQCICGGRDLDVWIGCDNPSCKSQWYHLDCMGLKKAPVGEWLCPRCRPIPRSGDQTIRPQRKASEAPLFPNLVKGPIAATQDETPARGIAMKKKNDSAKALMKEKPRWRGWVELSAEEEEKFKQSVEEPWRPDLSPDCPRRTRKRTLLDATSSSMEGQEESAPSQTVEDSCDEATDDGIRPESTEGRSEATTTDTGGETDADDEMTEADEVTEAEEMTEADWETVGTRTDAEEDEEDPTMLDAKGEDTSEFPEYGGLVAPRS